MWQTREGAEQRAGHSAILSYKTSQTCSEQCGITQGFPCGGSEAPDVQQNSFLGNPDRKRGKNSPVHILSGTWHTPVCLSGTVHHSGLLNYHLVTLKPAHWERVCQVQKEVRLMPRIWRQKNLEFSQSFPSHVLDKKMLLAHPINVLLPRAHCKMGCAGAFQPSEDRKQSLKHYTACISLYQTVFPRNAAPGLVRTWKWSPCHSRGREGRLSLPQAHMVSPDPGNHLTPSHCADVPLFIFQASSESIFPSWQLSCTGSVLMQAALLLPFWSQRRGMQWEFLHPHAIGLLFKMLSSTARDNPVSRGSL